MNRKGATWNQKLSEIDNRSVTVVRERIVNIIGAFVSSLIAGHLNQISSLSAGNIIRRNLGTVEFSYV